MTGSSWLCFLSQRSGSLTRQQNDEGHDDRRHAAPEHGAPAEVRAHRVVQRGGQKEAGIITGLQITSAHLAAVFRPRFGDVGPSQRPLAANSDSCQQPKQPQLPHVLRQRGRAREHRIDEDGGGQHSRAAKPVSDRAPDQRQSPANQEQRKQHRSRIAHVARRSFDSRLWQQLGERRTQHQRVDDRVHAIERPASPRRPEAGDLRAIEFGSRADPRVRHRKVGHGASSPQGPHPRTETIRRGAYHTGSTGGLTLFYLRS